jgi:hypothetical protein
MVKVLEAGVVGNLDYKIIEARRADDFFAWLKENKYSTTEQVAIAFVRPGQALPATLPPRASASPPPTR